MPQGPDELYFLSASDRAKLQRLLSRVDTLDNPSPINARRRNLQSSKVIIGALTSAVGATTALLGKPKVGTLNVYSFSSTGVEDTGIDVTVYNFAPAIASTDRWTVCVRDAFTGKLIIDAQFCS